MDDAIRLRRPRRVRRARESSEANGKLRGLGFANAIERAAPPGMETPNCASDPSGAVTILSGTTQQGQGQRRCTPSFCATSFGLEPDHVRVIEGDTDRLAFGFGAGGSFLGDGGSADDGGRQGD